MKVCKFGGTSLADAAQVNKVCGIVLSDPERRVVVVSAPGKRSGKDTKVTDLLIACAEQRMAGNSAEKELQDLVQRFASIVADMSLPADVLEEIVRDLKARVESDRSHKAQFMDRMKAAGEDNMAKLVAAALRHRGAHARYLSPREGGLLLSEEYGNAQLLPESYQNLSAMRDWPGITVFPGFFGYTRKGEVVTFPRGGSDITGAILAVAVEADVYENFTDVDSVFAVDPRIVPEAQPISELTYREMRELAYAGFSVLHEEAIIPTVRAGIPICIKNTNRPEAPGTSIVPERKYCAGAVVGIASDKGFCTIYVSKYLMNREIGFGRRLLQICEEEGLSYEHAPSGIDNLSVILREATLDPAAEQRVADRIRKELGADDVDVERGLALIMIVGEGMRYTVGVAARAARALADAGVNIEMMNQGSSEISMMFGVKAVDRKKAVESLHHEFFSRHHGSARDQAGTGQP
jgi:aspartate kinase